MYPDEMTADKNGALYGALAMGGGGTCGECGATYKLTPGSSGYAFTRTHRFVGGKNFHGGGDPVGPLVIGSDGSIYGDTRLGGGCASGNSCGIVFRLVPEGKHYHEHVLYRFQAGADGSQPSRGVAMDRNGVLYGTTGFSGDPACDCGTVFSLRLVGHTWQFTTLHTFTGAPDGALPQSPIAIGADGTLYGTTTLGGVKNASCGTLGCGTVYALHPGSSGYSESIVYAFPSAAGAAFPQGDISVDTAGDIYGAAATEIFALRPAGSGYTKATLHHLAGGTTLIPMGVTAGPDGTLYGAVYNGGRFDDGTLFSIHPDGKAFKTLHDFVGAGGIHPAAPPFLGADGALYGTAETGGGQCGSAGCGTAFRLTLPTPR